MWHEDSWRDDIWRFGFGVIAIGVQNVVQHLGVVFVFL
jgi:hypothetical protein